jgi:hypothetical protein
MKWGPVIWSMKLKQIMIIFYGSKVIVWKLHVYLYSRLKVNTSRLHGTVLNELPECNWHIFLPHASRNIDCSLYSRTLRSYIILETTENFVIKIILFSRIWHWRNVPVSSSSKQGLGKTACSDFISWSLWVILIIPQHRVPVCGWVVEWWVCHLWASRLARFSVGVSSLRQLSSLTIEVYLPLALPFL